LNQKLQPDLRNPILVQEVSEHFRGSGFKVFARKQAPSNCASFTSGPICRANKLPAARVSTGKRLPWNLILEPRLGTRAAPASGYNLTWFRLIFKSICCIRVTLPAYLI
jgi:hypothetical protein